MSKLRIALLQTQGGGVDEYRLWIPARALIRAGYTANSPLPSSPFTSDRSLIEAANGADVIHVGYISDVGMIERLVALREYLHIPIVVDLDDDIYNVPTYNEAYRYYHAAATARRSARLQMRVSDGVTVSTSPLATLYTSSAKRIAHLPNCHDEHTWQGLPTDPHRRDDRSIRMMFAGNTGRYGDLTETHEAIEQAMQFYDGTDGKPMLRLIFMGCIPDWAGRWMLSSSDPAANRAFGILGCFNVATYRATLRWLAPDIFFSPVQANEFNKSKSHIKAFDAAEAGAAFLCTDWPTYGDVPTSAAIKVSNTTTQWREAIGALVEDAALRTRLNTRLKEWVADTQLIDTHIHRWVDFYTAVREGGIVQSIEDVVRPRVPDPAPPSGPVREVVEGTVVEPVTWVPGG